ncbi:TPA: hypothetical protein ACSA6A_005044 [Salmonella enterica subsp. enterica serovar Muenchen]
MSPDEYELYLLLLSLKKLPSASGAGKKLNISERCGGVFGFPSG